MTKSEVQLGKKGLSYEFLEDLKTRFDKFTNKSIKVNVLKSARETKKDVKEYAEKIQKALGDKFTFKVVGFTIVMRKWRKARK